MRAVWLPLVEGERKRLPDHAEPVQNVPTSAEGGARSPSLMTPLGLMEGAVLTYLEEHGATMLRDLIRKLGRSAAMVTMGVGALIREGLVEGRHQNLDVLCSLR